VMFDSPTGRGTIFSVMLPGRVAPAPVGVRA